MAFAAPLSAVLRCGCARSLVELGTQRLRAINGEAKKKRYADWRSAILRF